jgi:cGMP-dependent protein kinase
VKGFVGTKRGHSFGEKRNATVVADPKAGALVLFRIHRDDWFELHLHNVVKFPNRKATVPGYPGRSHHQRNREKSPNHIIELVQALKKNNTFRYMPHLTDGDFRQMAESAYMISCSKDEQVLRYGDIDADQFFVVKEGTFNFSHPEVEADPETGESRSVSRWLGKAEKGDTFGELALIHHAPRASSVHCGSQDGGYLWVIDRQSVKEVVCRKSDVKMGEVFQILNDITTFSMLLSDEKAAIAEALVEITFKKDDRILRAGEAGMAFFILANGKVNITTPNQNDYETKPKVTYLEADASAGNYKWFGERALLRNELIDYTVSVASEDVTVLALKRSVFETILAPHENCLLDQGLNRRSKILAPPATRMTPQGFEPCELGDLERVGPLGCGGFGAVTLEKHLPSNKTYALKALSKGYIVKMKMQKGVLREKEILSICDSDFIVHMFQTFKTQNYLYFLLEAAMGGELFATYHKYRFHGSVSKAKFYSACVVIAFTHLHERNVIYRDLKPENLLLDEGGFCKLADMGLAKITTVKTYTTCGTPDYFAPEVVQQSGQTCALDWWTLGVLIHELLSGHAPFEASHAMETYQKIVKGVSRVDFSYLRRDPDGVDIVKQILRATPADRLPMRVRNGGDTQGNLALMNLRAHPWYRGFDWEGLWNFDVRPPFIPSVRSPTDLSNFRCNETDMPPQMPYTDDGGDWDRDF